LRDYFAQIRGGQDLLKVFVVETSSALSHSCLHCDNPNMDIFMRAAIDEACLGAEEGGIPIGSVLVHDGRILGRGHNRRVQKGSAILHAEMDALENAGRQTAQVYRESVLYTTL
jgi:pyrimidine deaminase RibD-like protein